MARRGPARPDVIGRVAPRIPGEHAGNHRREPGPGVGTGGFGKAYADRFAGTGAPATKNPHNEILLMIVQFGIAGFVLLRGPVRHPMAARAAPPEPLRNRRPRARFVLTIAVTSLLSSTLLDHAEGFFFVYMSGLLFAGYRAHVPEAPRAAGPVSPAVRGARAPTVPAPASVLVIVTRRLGDVLLAAPLLRSIKAAWPQAAVDALALRRHEGCAREPSRRATGPHGCRAARNCRARGVHLPPHSSLRPCAVVRCRRSADALCGARRPLSRRARQCRARACGLEAMAPVAIGRFRQSRHPHRRDEPRVGGRPWRSRGITRSTSAGAPRTPRTSLRCSPASNVRRPTPRCTCIRNSTTRCGMSRDGWGWRNGCGSAGSRRVLTGGSDRGEIEFATAVAAQMPAGTINLAGQLSFAQSACAIAGARLFVGPDTVTTHMAAALGVPTVALYGPSNPGEMGAVADQDFDGSVVAVAPGWRAVDGQCRARPGRRRVRSLHARGLRPARRELFRLPAAVAAPARSPRRSSARSGSARARSASREAAPLALRTKRAAFSAPFIPARPSRDVPPARTGTRSPRPARAAARCG